jgi:hypothetical protein
VPEDELAVTVYLAAPRTLPVTVIVLAAAGAAAARAKAAVRRAIRADWRIAHVIDNAGEAL